jgi:predicted XRE-type DNA-binding protein
MIKDDDCPAIELVGTSVFHGLGFEDADELVIKAELTQAVMDRVSARGLNKAQAAVELGMSRPEASHLLNGHLDRFTIDRLIKALAAIDAGSRVRVVIDSRDEVAS